MQENTHEPDERRVAEDFRRQLQERSLAGRAHPPTAELLRWLDQNAELLEQIAHVSCALRQALDLPQSSS
jgi:hypothetical protein